MLFLRPCYVHPDLSCNRDTKYNTDSRLLIRKPQEDTLEQRKSQSFRTFPLSSRSHLLEHETPLLAYALSLNRH